MSVSIHDLAAYKARGEKFVMLTAYDFPTAQILDEAGVPVLLVGDSLAQVILGYDTTIPVSVDEMLHHPTVMLGLGDSGAHVGQIMDASLPTFFLAHWVRDRGVFSLEDGSRRLTSDTAGVFGVADRGVIA